jgi:hypothetical protein
VIILSLRASGLPQSQYAQYENHHNNDTNNVKNIHVRFSFLSRDWIIFKPILGEMTGIMNM